MTNVHLYVEKEWRVVADSLAANGQSDHKGGNLNLLGGNEVTWKASQNPGWVKKFKVTFKAFDTNAATWPFAKKVDGTDAPEDYVATLELEPGDSVTLPTRGGGPRTVKYDVVVETQQNQEAPEKTPVPLDPMIIIRPGLRSIIEAGLPWAAAGAAIGALITWSIFVR